MYSVYILRSEKDGNRYIGSTEDVEKRLKEHNAGKVRSTKGRRPLFIMYKEDFKTRTEAIKREYFLKSGQGRLWIKGNVR